MVVRTTIAIIAGLVASAVADTVIVPGAPWTDTSGNRIQAHGGGLLKVGSTYYWHGEDKSHNSGTFKAVSCYSSTDLMSWSRGTDALTPQSGTNISTSNIVERPKVIYNSKNSEYVMWFHSDSSNYGAAMVGVATATTPCGPFSYRGSFKPFSADSRDMGVYVDDDSAKTAYLLYASDNNQNFKIAKMDTDYYTLSSVVSQINASTLESPGIIKRSGVYYLFASHTTGWAPNPNKVLTASSLSGSWSSESDIATSNTRTYYSQNSYNLPLSTSSAVYMGDRWRSSVLGDSRYIWLPMTWSSGSPKLVWADVWTVNLSAGTYTVASGTTYEAESGTRGGNSTLLSNSAFSGGQAIGYLGKGGTLTLSNVQGTGASGGQWVSVYYANGDSTYRNVTITVNGGSSVLLDQPDSGGGGVVLSVPVKLALKSGANTLVFASSQTTHAADLDKVIVY